LPPAYVRPPHPLDLKEMHLSHLWTAQEMTPDPVLSQNLRPLWQNLFPHGEVTSMVMITTGISGPLSSPDLASFRCSGAESLVAAYIARAWGLARNPTQKGILAGKPAYEAWDMICGRVRSARSESPSWSRWWLRLLAALKVKPEQVPQEYAMVLPAAIPTLPPWPKSKGDLDFWNNVNTCASLIAREPGWRWQYLALVAESKKDSTPSYLDVSEITEAPNA